LTHGSVAIGPEGFKKKTLPLQQIRQIGYKGQSLPFEVLGLVVVMGGGGGGGGGGVVVVVRG
jgi:hypothetical protein